MIPPTAPPRRGPRPLLLHLGLAMLHTSASRAGWQNSKPGSPSWSAILEQVSAVFAGLAKNPAPPGPAQRGASLLQNHELIAPDLVAPDLVAPDLVAPDLIAGIAAYRRHPWQRVLRDPPACWEEGGSRLLDYAQGAGGPTVLFVPSLVNRATVLDLMEGNSMLRHLAAHGIRPLLLDWGWPGPLERGFTLADYIAGRLERAIGAAADIAGGPIVLAGYCMGGTLAVAAALRQPHLLRGLALLATPWDFHAGDPARAQQLAALLPLLEPAMALTAALPVDALQTLFTMLDPWGVGAKYRAFAGLDPDSDRARLFVALEDWLNDGIPLAAPLARACLGEWYGENRPARDLWSLAGMPVDPRKIDLPCFVAAPGRDRIVPPDSARPLAALIPGAILHEPLAGHIGMVAGANAEAVLWRPLRDWLARF